MASNASKAAAPRQRGAFVWVWLPGHTSPVVAGRIGQLGDRYGFVYGTSYLARPDRVPIYGPELPLTEKTQMPDGGRVIASCLRDASPDAWGRRVILARRFGRLSAESDTGDLDELTYMLGSGSDRIGALDFQASATTYVPRNESATLAELVGAAERVESGQPLPESLREALLSGTAIGGARPKATLRDEAGRHLIVKFSSSADHTPVVKAEALGMVLAERCGLDVARCEVIEVMGRDALIVERFDRTPVAGERKMMVSALTILATEEMFAHHSSYPELADAIRKHFKDPTRNRRELYSRMVFNVCIGNTDDHLRNHAAFWDGKQLDLTPAYDLYPNPRSGEVANQAIAITRVPGEKASQLQLCLKSAPDFGLTISEAEQIIDSHVETITREFKEAADLAGLSVAQRDAMWHREILNPYIFYDQA